MEIKNQRNTADLAVFGCGWLGFPLAARAAARGERVHGSTTTAAKLDVLSRSGIDPFLLSLGSAGDWLRFLEAGRLLVCMPVNSRHKELLPALEAFAELIDPKVVERIIYTSSTGIYGQQQGRIDDDAPVDQQDDNARVLAAAEEIFVSRFAKKVTILRLSGLAGPGRHPGRWLAGRRQLPGGADPVNLVHLADVLAIIEGLFARHRPGGVYNVSAPQHPARQDFYPFAAAMLGLQAPAFDASQAGGAGKLIACSGLHEELGYTFQFPDPFGFVYT
jgi:nucleoside-diphosphate-sugar epimerase